MNDKVVFTVKRYEIKFLQDVKNLWKEQYNPDYISQREILFRWLTEENPFLNDESPYFILFDKETLVGMLGHMPLEFTINGEKKRGYLSQDILLAKDYRGKGLGKVLLRAIKEQTTSFAGALWFNEPNYHLYLKSGGWVDVPGFNPFVRIFDPRVFLKNRVKNRTLLNIVSKAAKTISQIRDILYHRKSLQDINIIKIAQFEQGIDNFFDSISPRLGFIVARNQDYLNWKFVKKPFSNYSRYVALDDLDELSGYMVTKREVLQNEVSGKILDILAHPDKPRVFAALISKALEEFVQVGASYVEIICTLPSFTREIRKLGFIQSPTPQRFMVQNWEGHFEKKSVTDIGNWYLTYSDADGDAWEVDNG